jgi:predicted dehydrogenase
MNPSRSRPTRRRFLQTSAVAGAGLLAASQFRRVRAADVAPGANEKLNVAFIGVGGKGSDTLNIFGNKPEIMKVVNVVAFCDADAGMVGNVAGKYPKAQKHKDYRRMFDAQKDIDAVVVSTPDHHHAPASLLAMRLGKHVYCEKPLTHSIYEARLMAQVAKENKLATQMGNSGHAGRGVRAVVEALRAGVLGKITEAHAWSNRPIWPQGIGRPDGSDPVPATLDWDLWLGPAPERPYVASRNGERTYHPFVWRGWWDFGTGALGDMGCHIIDPIFWGLDLGSPTSVEAEFESPHNDETAPNWSVVRYDFPQRGGRAPLKFTWHDGGKLPPAELSDGLVARDKNGKVAMDNGVLIVGEKGRLVSDRRAGYKLLPERDWKDATTPPKTLPDSPGHHEEWVNACRGGPATTDGFDYAGPLTELVLLGNVAIRAQKKIEWDAEKMQLTNAPGAQRYIRREYRKGWADAIVG